MERISYSPETLFHVLTHFETADEALRDSLRRAGFTDEAIDGQLRMPGSKFLRTFALSPQEAVARLQRDFPESFTALHPGADGRVRLSFRYDEPVGTSGLAADAELTPAEREAFNKAPFSLEDYKKSLKIGDVEGEVVDINFRSTKVRAVDNSIYILTNSTVSSATINNATLRNKRLYRFTLGVTYDTTRPQLEKLMADLTAMLKASPDAYEDTAFVRMTGFGDSSINLMVSAYLRTADYGVFLRMQNDLNLNIMDVMKADGVEFAFPSTTVYLEKEG